MAFICFVCFLFVYLLLSFVFLFFVCLFVFFLFSVAPKDFYLLFQFLYFERNS